MSGTVRTCWRAMCEMILANMVVKAGTHVPEESWVGDSKQRQRDQAGCWSVDWSVDCNALCKGCARLHEGRTMTEAERSWSERRP